MSEQNNTAAPSAPTGGRFPRYRPGRRTTFLIVVVLVLLVLFSLGPTYLARYFMVRTLDDFGIEHDGINTLRIHPWKREIWMGPVRFRVGKGDPGQLGELGIKFRVLPLLNKHVMIEKVLIRGIDIYVERDKNNRITLNGIRLDQIRPTAEPAEPTPSPDQTKPWGEGVGELEMRDSRVMFREKTGGTLALEIESLRLEHFISWQPDDPVSIQLKARINDIDLDLTGVARPFARHSTVTLDSRASGIELHKIIKFTGPLGLERRAGVYYSNLRHEITLFDTGRIEGHSAGKVILDGADYARAGEFALVAGHAEFDLDTRYSLNEKEQLRIDGEMAVDIVNATGKLAGERSFAVGSTRLVLAGLRATRDANNALHVTARPRLDLEQGAFTGRVQLSMDALLEVLGYLQSLSARPEQTPEQTGLEKWAGDQITLPQSDIAVDKLQTILSGFELKTTEGRISLRIAGELHASGLNVDVLERSTRVGKLDSRIETLQLHSGAGKLALHLDGGTAITDYRMQGPLDKGTIGRFETRQKVDLQLEQGNIRLEGSATAGIRQFQVVVEKTEALPRAALGVDAVNATLRRGMFALANGELQWEVEAGTTIDRASVEYAGGNRAAAKFRRLELRGAKADQDLRLGTEALLVSGLDVFVTRQFLDSLYHPAGDTEKNQGTTARPVPDQSGKPAEPAEPGKPELKLDRFALTDGARIRFRDNRVKPAVKVNLDLRAAELRDIDTRNPNKQARVDFVATINEFTYLKVQGKASNFGPKLNLILTSKLENLELPPYSPYAAEFGGVYLDSGQFSTDVEVKAQQGVLDGAIKLIVNGLDFKPLSEADAKRLSETAGMPIETAARLLQDAQGNIKLDLPVSGTVSRPKVDIGSAIRRAVGNTLKAVFPPTMIGSMLASTARQSALPTFNPVLFPAGSSELDAVARHYLDELATLLQERPRLSLDVCGRATPEDFAAITLIRIELPADPKPDLIAQRQRLLQTHGPKLRDLAIERTRVVRRYLISEKGLKASQVGECRPVFHPDDSGPPRVEVSL